MYTEIAQIYQYAQIIPAIKEIISNCYADEDIHVKYNWENIRDLVIEFCKTVAVKDIELANKIYNRMEIACSYTTSEKSNYVLMGDELQETIDLLYEGILLFGEIDIIEGNYRLFSSKSGFLSIQHLENKYIYHSTLDPMWEADGLAKRIYDSKFLGFHFLGCGLGYLPWQVYCISDCSADIYIFHNDEHMIQYALDYGVLGWIPEDKLHIVIEKDFGKLFQSFQASNKSYGEMGHYCLEDVKESFTNEQKEQVARYSAFVRTRTVWGITLQTNAYRNAFHVNNLITSFKPNTVSDEWIVVAAGPSLDMQLEYLRKNAGKRTIICASTVLKKLLSNGIRPDCVAVLDPQARTWGHFEKLEDMSVPLLLNVTANWRFGEYYKGPKYLVPSLTEETIVKDYLLQNIDSWFVGSTVTSMAIEVAVHLGAKTIEMVGVDLAYPTGKTHAAGTMDNKEIDTKSLLLVPCASGGMVPTTNQFLIYIHEIEDIIAANPHVRFRNLSTCGAKLKGAYCKSI